MTDSSWKTPADRAHTRAADTLNSLAAKGAARTGEVAALAAVAQALASIAVAQAAPVLADAARRALPESREADRDPGHSRTANRDIPVRLASDEIALLTRLACSHAARQDGFAQIEAMDLASHLADAHRTAPPRTG